jgi:5-methyltetrahydropteroyltriglutamate--homocysteine methyltransferase
VAIAANLGYPRIGRRRELKHALEAFWAGRIGEDELSAVARSVREAALLVQRSAGIDRIPVGFSLYDHVLDAAVTLGAIPPRYRSESASATYFAMARGTKDTAALEMTKWFDTNYHFIVPELPPAFTACVDSAELISEFSEGLSQGVSPCPAIVGPLTFVLLARQVDRTDPLSQLDAVVDGYITLLRQLAEAGIGGVRFDEPSLVLDLDDRTRTAYAKTYRAIANAVPNTKLSLATYFGPLPEQQVQTVLALPVTTLHLDLTRGSQPWEAIFKARPAEMELSLGIVDGRNIWRTDLDKALTAVERVADRIGSECVVIAPSCSLLHVPHDLDDEDGLGDDVRSWLAFGKEKLLEVRVITDGINGGRSTIAAALEGSAQVLTSRSSSPRVHNHAVAARLERLDALALQRTVPFKERHGVQQRGLNLPLLPTTTIGSFPQTVEVRKARAEFRAGRLEEVSYEHFLRAETERTIRVQEDLGLDVLVHGEFERNDMVEYFGEMLDGFVFTRHAWVQSYGSRCVKPPIIFGDVFRTAPMTVEWSRYAQSLTSKPVKGMLTGPVTILQWSFVRDDQPRDVTARQIALAIRDEVADLEQAGIRIIQIDEPALREGLPLRAADRTIYLRWAVDAFRLAASGVEATTQIHTHMCYGDFDEILQSIVELDADVISIEASRSNFALLKGLIDNRYPYQIGPGVYDIHSPRTPSHDEITSLIRSVVDTMPPEHIWVNPDCGLKTRSWPETVAALRVMVAAAQTVRAEHDSRGY